LDFVSSLDSLVRCSVVSLVLRCSSLNSKLVRLVRWFVPLVRWFVGFRWFVSLKFVGSLAGSLVRWFVGFRCSSLDF
jgi:hypothetical protein